VAQHLIVRYLDTASKFNRLDGVINRFLRANPTFQLEHFSIVPIAPKSHHAYATAIFSDNMPATIDDDDDDDDDQEDDDDDDPLLPPNRKNFRRHFDP
jgi:hypothetical protein